MKINIIEEKKEPLIPRVSYLINVEYEGKTPSREDLKKELSKILKSDEKLIIIKKIMNEFRKTTCKLDVLVYQDEKTLRMFETEQSIKRNTKKEQKQEKEGKQETKEEVKKEKPEENKEAKKGEKQENKKEEEIKVKENKEKEEKQEQKQEKKKEKKKEDKKE